MQTDLLVLAGEQSGDLHGEALLKALKKIAPDLSYSGVFGPNMRTIAKELFPMEQLSTMGFSDLLLSLPRLIKSFFAIKKLVLQTNPKAIVFIDYPGFHLRLAASLRKSGYRGKLIHYICPTIWAWAKGRMKTMEENLDLLLCIYPFEKECFIKSSLKVEYIGNPLTSQMQNSSPLPSSPIIGIFPGSRLQEVKLNLPLFLSLFKKLSSEDKTLTAAVSLSSSYLKEPILKILKEQQLDLPLVSNKEQLMRSINFALATSGTVTLELALREVPTVVGFKIRPIDFFLATKILKIRLPFYCIVNILGKEEIFPEHFGPNFTEEKLFISFKKLLKSKEEIKKGCKKIQKLLGQEDASLSAAKKILENI